MGQIVSAIIKVMKFIWKLMFNRSSVRQMGSSKVQSVLYEVDEHGIGKITLNRPKKKNAFSEAMYKEFTSTLVQISNDSKVKVGLIVGSGNFYSSGNDLSNFSKLEHPLSMSKKAKIICQDFVDSFITCKKPIIVAVNGPALGIAVTTLGLCDKVFASDNAYFKTPFSELGQAPEGCSSFTFPKILGPSLAEEVLWHGKTLTNEEALKHGLVHAIYPPEKVEMEAYQYCQSMISSSNITERWIEKENLREKLIEINRKETAILEKKWVSQECLTALSNYLTSRKMYTAAWMLRILNMTGWIWGQPIAPTVAELKKIL